MKGTRFLGMRTTLVVCILALALFAEAGFISVAWAGKPPKTTTSYGYATLTDTDSYVIQSDRGVQYIDKNLTNLEQGIVGEDMVEITTDSTGALVSIKSILGIVEYQSTRRVRFLFDVYNDATSRPGEGKAVYDILVDHGTPDGAVHFRVMYYASDSVVDDAAFIIDPGWNGTDPAITQAAVNNFYPDDTNEKYQTSEYGHVIYYIGYPGYPNPPSLTPVGGPPTWTIEPSGEVTLYVMRTVGHGKGQGNTYERVDLATYVSVPFKLTVSLNPIQAAPRKHNTLSTTWGKIKAK